MRSSKAVITITVNGTDDGFDVNIHRQFKCAFELTPEERTKETLEAIIMAMVATYEEAGCPEGFIEEIIDGIGDIAQVNETEAAFGKYFGYLMHRNQEAN